MQDEQIPLKYPHSSNHRIIASTWNIVEHSMFFWYLNSVCKKDANPPLCTHTMIRILKFLPILLFGLEIFTSDPTLD